MRTGKRKKYNDCPIVSPTTTQPPLFGKMGMIEETPLECLLRLGTSGVLWAKEFNKTAVKLGYPEMDEEWLAGWFANAIENCDVELRCEPIRRKNQALKGIIKAGIERVAAIDGGKKAKK